MMLNFGLSNLKTKTKVAANLTFAVVVLISLMVSIHSSAITDEEYQHAFKRAEEGDATVVPILISAWSDDERTGNDSWREKWGAGEIPHSARDGKEYSSFCGKVIASFRYIGKDALPYIFEAIKSNDEFVIKRAKRAAQLLIYFHIFDETCIPMVLEYLNDDNDEVRIIAVEMLTKRTYKWLEPTWENLLKDRNEIIRYKAAFALAKLKNTSAIPVLLEACDYKEDARVRKKAIRGFWEAKEIIWIPPEIREAIWIPYPTIEPVPGQRDVDAAIADKLVKALEDDNRDVRRAAIFAVRALQIREATPALTALLDTESLKQIRGEVALAIGNLGDKSAIPILKEALESESEIRVEVSIALANLGDKSGIDVLKDAATKKGLLQWNIIEALGNIGDKSAIPVLSTVFLEQKKHRPAMEALVKIGKASVPVLIEGTKREYETRFWAIKGLKRIKDKSSIRALVEMKAGFASAMALREIGKPAVKLLKEKLKSEEPEVRWHAAIALGDIEGDKAADALADLLNEGEIAEQKLVDALRQIKGDKATHLLLGLLNQDNFQAARILCERGNSKGVAIILDALKNGKIKPDMDSLIALAKSDDRKALEYLQDYYYSFDRTCKDVTETKFQLSKRQKLLSEFEDAQGITWIIFNWRIYGSPKDIWLTKSIGKASLKEQIISNFPQNLSIEQINLEQPIFTGIISEPVRRDRHVKKNTGNTSQNRWR